MPSSKNSSGIISIHALVKRATSVNSDAEPTEVISIHALVKRATRFIVYIITYLCISIHALVKRATGYHWDWDEKKLFQSTPS